jgi:4-hydroxy-tetrahydrodipicolinate reductase
MIRVAVAGALGRMGRVAYAALHDKTVCAAHPGVTYAGGFARTRVPQERIVDDLDELFNFERPDVLLDLTTHPGSVDISMQAVTHGIRPVIGATGWTADERSTLEKLLEERGLGALMVPNFSIGAILMMRFAEEAARFFPAAEIVEMHHDRKKDKPSGTARLTADRIMAQAGHPDVPIHSVRLRGLVAHQQVMFGSDGEILTIRHDSLARESYVPGIMRAVEAVMNVNGLVVGLDSILDGEK